MMWHSVPFKRRENLSVQQSLNNADQGKRSGAADGDNRQKDEDAGENDQEVRRRLREKVAAGASGNVPTAMMARKASVMARVTARPPGSKADGTF